MTSPLRWRSAEARKIIMTAPKGSRVGVLYLGGDRRHPVVEVFPAPTEGVFAVHVYPVGMSEARRRAIHAEDRAFGSHRPISQEVYEDCRFMLDGTDMGYRGGHAGADGEVVPTPDAWRDVRVFVAADRFVTLGSIYDAARLGVGNLSRLVEKRA